MDLFREKVFTFLQNVIKEHRQHFQEGNNNDFIDTYLNEVAKTDDPESSFHPKNIGGGKKLNPNRNSIYMIKRFWIYVS